MDDKVLRVFARRSQAYASNTHIFLLWMVGTSMVLLIIAILFLRGQIRPILSLADAAESFGKGQKMPEDFSPARRRRNPPCRPCLHPHARAHRAADRTAHRHADRRQPRPAHHPDALPAAACAGGQRGRNRHVSMPISTTCSRCSRVIFPLPAARRRKMSANSNLEALFPKLEEHASGFTASNLTCSLDGPAAGQGAPQRLFAPGHEP